MLVINNGASLTMGESVISLENFSIAKIPIKENFSLYLYSAVKVAPIDEAASALYSLVRYL